MEPLEARQLLTVLPAGFAETQVGTSDFVSPTSMTLAPDGRVFVAEQSGELRVIKNGSILSTPFLTVPTDTENERGLVGVEVDPNFATNHFVYVTYIATQPDFHLRLSRFTADGDVAAAGSETILYETVAMRTSFHIGGAIHFGPDGKLYMSVGENGGGTAAQELTSQKGKILRMNPDGSIPADNPFVSQTTGNLGAIWAMGFRNPFSFNIQPTTGRLFANDVGTSVWEEVDDVVPGDNYGYPDVEGATNDPRFHGPLFTYQHPEGCAIVGASFYNPASATFPVDLLGDYFFGDLCKRYIKTIDPATGAVSPFATALPGRPVDIDVAPDGSLYYLARPNPDSIGQPGGVFKVTFTNSNAPSIGVQPQNKLGAAGQPVTFTVGAAGAAPLSYQWQRKNAGAPAFADITGAAGSSHTIDAVSAADDGAQFRVVVSNSAGTATSNAATLTLAAGQAPVPTILTPAEGTLYSGGQTLSFSGSATDAEDGTLPASAFTWRIDLYHDEQDNPHTHPEMPPTSGITSGTHEVATAGHTENSVWLRVFLTVRDSSGLETTIFRDVQPHKVNVTLASNVPGLRLNLDGTPQRAPDTFAAVSGIDRTLAAPPTQTVNGVTYQFVNWSDAGAPTHTINTPASDATYTAVYQATDGGTGNAQDPDLTAALAGRIPAAAVTGAPGRTRVRVTNAGVVPFAGAVNVRLFASPDPWLDPEDTAVTTVPRTLNLRAGASRNVPVAFAYPDVIDGQYYLLAYADSRQAGNEKDETNNVAVSAAPLTLAPAFIDLSGSFLSSSVNPVNRRGVATLLVRNDGNTTATGVLTVALAASTDNVADANDVSLGGASSYPLKLKGGASKRIRLRFAPPATAGQYFLTVTLDPNNAIAERDDANNAAVTASPFTVA